MYENTERQTTTMAKETPEPNRPTKGEISIITEYTKGNSTNKTRRKLKKILKKHKITSEDQLAACKEDLKQALQSKVQRLLRY